MQLGVSLWPQYTTWDALLDSARRVDELGYDSLYTWDHFLPIMTDPSGPNLEAWQVLAAWAASTRRVRLGTMVTGIPYRNPAVLAKMVSTLDHVSHGRAILGIGAGWFELEHQQYGLHYGTAGERLSRLDEAAQILRGLLSQSRFSFHGQYYQVQEAWCEPKPVQAHLPMLIGGGGERRTLRIVARHADYWNGDGPPEQIAHKLDVLRGHCREVGRNFDDIVPTVMCSVVIRNTESELRAVYRRIAETNRLPDFQAGCGGTVDEVTARLRDYARVGVREVILSVPAPQDLETLERVATEVRPGLEPPPR